MGAPTSLGGSVIDIRNTEDRPTILEHDDTVRSRFLVDFEEMREATMGSYLQFIDEFFVEAGVQMEPHRHNTHEFYYVLEGSAFMTVGSDSREIGPRDLVHIPPNEPHSLRGGPDGVLAFAFAASFLAPGESHTAVDLPA